MKTRAGIEEKSRGEALGRKRRIHIVRIPRSSIPNKTEYQTGSRKNSEKVLTPFAPKKFIPRNPLNGNHTDRNTTKHQKCRRNQERNQGHGERSREEDEGEEELDWSTTSWGWVGGEAWGTEPQRTRRRSQNLQRKQRELPPLTLSRFSSARERERRCNLQQRRQQPFRPLWAADEQGSLSRLGSSSLPSAGQSLLVTVFSVNGPWEE